MKKNLVLLILTLLSNILFAQNFPEKIKEKLEKSNLFVFNKIDALKYKKPTIEFFCESNEDFTRITSVAMDQNLLQNITNIDYNSLKKMFIDEKNIFGNSYLKFEWQEGNNLGYSIMYSQQTERPIYGAGVYVIRIFDKEYVYTIRLSDYTKLDEPNDEYNTLNDIFVYKNGQKEDRSKGLEQTQGYYCINENSAEKFYTKLKNKDKSLPKSAQNFEKARLFIEDVLNHY